MKQITFPYTMRCPKCSVGIKVKSEKMLGRMVNCPKCDKRIEIVAPDEDGSIPYGIAEAHTPEPEPEPTEDELEEYHAQRRRERREKANKQAKHILSIVWLLALLAGLAWGLYYFVWEQGYAKRGKEAKPDLSGQVTPEAPTRWIS